MKTFKKIIAVVLAVITIMSLGMISSSAASVNPPKFELRLISQDNSKATLQLWLVGGEFNSIDIEFKTSDKIGAMTYFATTDAFDKYVKELKNDGNAILESASTTTQKLSLASTAKINRTISVYDIVIAKATAADLALGDITATINECVISNGTTEERVASQVKVAYIFGKLEIAEESIELKYKDSAKLNIDTTYKSVVWSTSNSKVATVDENGNVYAAHRGTATITAQSADGSVSDSCKVTVKYTAGQWMIIIFLFGWIWY